MALLTTGLAGITPQFQKYLDKNILEHAVQATVLDQFALRKAFPKNLGALTIRFFRANVAVGALDTTAAVTLTEGVSPSILREIVWTPIDMTLAQYGEVSVISDILDATALLDTAKQVTATQGEDAALVADTIIRNVIMGVGVITGNNKRYAQGLATWAALAAATQANGAVSMTDILDSMTQLDVQRAPMINGEYVMIATPQVIRDLMNDQKVFVPAGVYGTKKDLFKGEVGTYFGVRVVKTTNPFIENGANAGTEGTYDASGTSANKIYVSLVVGKDAYGTPIMAGGSPFSPTAIVTRGSDKSDLLNQRTGIGWKAFWTAGVLNPAWIVTLRSKSVFG